MSYSRASFVLVEVDLCVSQPSVRQLDSVCIVIQVLKILLLIQSGIVCPLTE
jgi:hypothetical protein